MEYFDNINYIIEQAIKCLVGKEMQNMQEFVGIYISFIHRQREFFLKFFSEDSIERFDFFLDQHEFRWVGNTLLSKFPADEKLFDSPPEVETSFRNVQRYIEYRSSFLQEAEKIFKPKTIEQIDEVCMTKLKGLISKSLGMLSREFTVI